MTMFFWERINYFRPAKLSLNGQLQWAAGKGNIKTAKEALAKGADPLCSGGQAFISAVLADQVKVLQLMTSHLEKNDQRLDATSLRTMFRSACDHDSKNCALFLISKGVDPNAQDGIDLRRALHSGSVNTVTAVLDGYALSDKSHYELFKQIMRGGRMIRSDVSQHKPVQPEEQAVTVRREMLVDIANKLIDRGVKVHDWFDEPIKIAINRSGKRMRDMDDYRIKLIKSMLMRDPDAASWPKDEIAKLPNALINDLECGVLRETACKSGLKLAKDAKVKYDRM
ncbi:MAG: ankyrin repeat domain-containing protein, partial [Pseudomonadota bacterium]|nr:ankyrin repeat domain-containing protein [Pseudomonadota bacterium]